MRRLNGPVLFLGGGALLAGVLVFGVSLGLAVSGPGGGTRTAPADVAAPDGATLDRTASRLPGSGLQGSTAADPSGPTTAVQPEVLRLAVSSAPFEESRLQPRRRYQLPSDEPAPVARQREEEPPEVPEFRLLGSVKAGDRSWALVAVEDGDPILLRPGESLSGYTLAAVEEGSAVMASAAQVVQVPLNQPSMTIRNERESEARNARGRGGNNNNNNNNQAAQRRAETAVQEGIQQFLQSGGAGAVQGILQQLTGGGGAIGNILQGLGGNFQVAPGGAGAAGAQRVIRFQDAATGATYTQRTPVRVVPGSPGG